MIQDSKYCNSFLSGGENFQPGVVSIQKERFLDFNWRAHEHNDSIEKDIAF